MVLLIAPDATERSELAATIERLGRTVIARTAEDMPASEVDRFDAVIVDLAAGQDALRFLRRINKADAHVPIIVIPDRRRLDVTAEALRVSAMDIIERPVRADAIAAALYNAREFVTQPPARERPSPPPEIDQTPAGIFGPSPIMRSVLTMARRVAPSRCAVLIVGERGTGREMVAKVIHGAGSKNGEPFIKLACSALTSEDLHGVVQGAPASTIYLENLSELPPGLQEELEACVRASAAERDPATDAPRFIGGAQPRVWALIDRGEVRRSLIEALSIVRIDLPPLRQRPEDIPLLAMRFLKDACTRNGSPAKTFEPAAMTLLTALPWPGNAKELESLCERLAVVVTRGVVRLEDIVANVRFEGAEAIGRSREPLKAARDRFERDHIAAALQHHKGRMGAAARELGIERTNLYRKIKQLGIRWEGESD
jgi:DNA-binding NtrC family response regulator